jgi:predicted nucleotidyltransferase
MDLLAERIATRDRAARDRADALRVRLPSCARRLRARGATRVVLFGSLVTEAPLHASTDVDLAVWGLSERDVVDLVRAESAGASLLARIARDGKEL